MALIEKYSHGQTLIASENETQLIVSKFDALIDYNSSKDVAIYYRWDKFYRMGLRDGQDVFNEFRDLNLCDVYILFENANELGDVDLIIVSQFCSKSMIEINEHWCVDAYIISKDFSWFFCITHEEEIGPFFYGNLQSVK